MAKKYEIELFISDEGEVKVHVRGMKGSGCLDVANALAKQIGELKEKEFTSEYYEKPDTTTNTSTHIC